MSTDSRQRTHESFWPYAVLAGCLLLILTAAILTPDVLNYLQRTERAAAHPVAPEAKMGSASNQIECSEPVVIPPPEMSAKTDSAGLTHHASIYETYAKLVTLMLGFVSVVGVLAGYFVRKSVREVTEDVRDEVEREVKRFEQHKKEALKKVEDAENTAKRTLKETEKLKSELDVLLKKYVGAMKVIDELTDAARPKPKSILGNTPDVAARVDQQLGDQP